MFLQTVIKVICYFLLSKFIEYCNQLPSGRVADAARCMGLCTKKHCMCALTVAACEMTENEQ